MIPQLGSGRAALELRTAWLASLSLRTSPCGTFWPSLLQSQRPAGVSEPSGAESLPPFPTSPSLSASSYRSRAYCPRTKPKLFPARGVASGFFFIIQNRTGVHLDPCQNGSSIKWGAHPTRSASPKSARNSGGDPGSLLGSQSGGPKSIRPKLRKLSKTAPKLTVHAENWAGKV